MTDGYGPDRADYEKKQDGALTHEVSGGEAEDVPTLSDFDELIGQVIGRVVVFASRR